MVKQREAGLFLSPKKKHKKVPLVGYGKTSGSAWAMRLHDKEEKQTGMTVTLESDLNSKLEAANARRKEDTKTTKKELANIEEQVTKKLGGISTRLTDHDK